MKLFAHSSRACVMPVLDDDRCPTRAVEMGYVEGQEYAVLRCTLCGAESAWWGTPRLPACPFDLEKD